MRARAYVNLLHLLLIPFQHAGIEGGGTNTVAILLDGRGREVIQIVESLSSKLLHFLFILLKEFSYPGFFVSGFSRERRGQ